jgi:hypothetical protein
MQYLPDAWKPVLDADVDGPASTPARIDAERAALGARGMTRRIARSIFLGSAPTLHSAHRGIERQRAWLGAALPGDAVDSFALAADLLGQRATYLYVEGSRSWYDTEPSVTRTAADRAEALREHPEEAWHEIVERLRASQSRYAGAFAAVRVAPRTSAEVPDGEEVQLVVLHPSLSHSRGSTDSAAVRYARDVFEHRGTAQRTNRNQVLFLAPDSRRVEELSQAARELLAWRWVRGRREELGLSAAQVRTVETRLDSADRAVTTRVGQAYHWALVPDQPDPTAPPTITAERVEGAGDRLAETVSEKLARAGLLSTVLAERSIRLELDSKLSAVWARGHVRAGELWGYYRHYPYLTRLRDRRVLDEGVAGVLDSMTWDVDAFALAEGLDEASGRYTGLALPGAGATFGPVLDSTLLVAPAVALAQQAAAASAAGQRGTGENPKGGGDDVGAPRGLRPRSTRFTGLYRIDQERLSRDLTALSQEILQPLAAVEGVTLTLSVEVRAECSEGFPDNAVRVVLENARALRLAQAAFEDNV